MALIEQAEVTTTYLNIKFEPSIKVSTLVNAAFSVTNTTDDPDIVVASPFKTIDVTRDYNSLAKVLTLYWNDTVLEPSNSYSILIDGLQNAAGTELDSGNIEFITPDTLPTEPEENDVNVPPVAPVIVDFTLESGDYDFVGEDPMEVSKFKLLASDPIHGTYYLEPDYADGKITLSFSHTVTPGDIDTDHFRVQRRKIERGPTRWEPLTVTVEAGTADTDVVITLPDTDGVFYEENYKYRILISNTLATTNEDVPEGYRTLLNQGEIIVAGVISPMLISPDELLGSFPDASEVEIAELIRINTIDILSILKATIGDSLPYTAYEYVLAATACALSKSYGNAALDADSNATRMRLGDLEVNKGYGSGFASNRKITPESATTWCELAAALRKVLVSQSVGFKAVRRGSAHPNPVPSRRIHRTPQKVTATWPAYDRTGV